MTNQSDAERLIDRLRDRSDIIPDMTVRQANAHLICLCDEAADALEAARNLGARRVVPIRPAQAMLIAGREVFGPHVEDTVSDYQRIYATMLSAAPDAPQPATNEADELLAALNLDPDTYRTDGGWLNIPKIKAAIASPEDYPHIAQPANQAVTPCQNESMGKHACTNRAQCWEPCGELGNSAEHARPIMRNFCGRCGKRLGSILSIHTCTPPPAVQPAEPLTDEQRQQIVAMWSRTNRNFTVSDIIDAVEAAHNIKPKEA